MGFEIVNSDLSDSYFSSSNVRGRFWVTIHFFVWRAEEVFHSWADSVGGGGGCPDPHPLENHKNIGFHSNTGPDPLKNHKATKPVFNVGTSSHHRHARRFAGGPLMTRE